MITYNDQNFFKDGKVWFPVMGEFQYSRSDSRFWNEGIAKMKALGIDTVASYCFWIHHEEIEGHFNFRSRNNLRKFLRLVGENGMQFCLRIGPWVHGEARNGGFPDWLYDKDFVLRSNDPGYMAVVRRYFTEIYHQCQGYFSSEGGPIFAIQVENEYSQWGRQTDTEGDVHINALIAMLRDIGFDVPVYFATGWGQAAVGEAIPVWGAYAEAPWEHSREELPPQEGYLISYNPNDSNIGSDTGKKEMDADITGAHYPYATVELGSGIQVTLTRRPVIRGEDAENLVLCKLASGVSAIGYYVFHGGMNPIGALTTMQEYRNLGLNRAGCYCDLPIINYDFQGAVSQYGVMTDLGKHLKLYNYFAADFGAEMAGMTTYLPPDNAQKPEDLQSLRYSVRYRGDRGFVFFNNFVRRYDMPERHIRDFEAPTGEPGKPLARFDLNLKNGESGIYPVNLPVGDGVVRFINATPLCRLNGTDCVFWKNEGELDLRADGKVKDHIIVLDKDEAVHAFKFRRGGTDYLLISNGGLYESEGQLHAEYREDLEIRMYPHGDMPPAFEYIRKEGRFDVYRLRYDPAEVASSIELTEPDGEASVFRVTLGDTVSEEDFVRFSYTGSRVEIYADGERIADDYYTGRPYEIALKYHGRLRAFDVKVYPLHEDDFVYLETYPDFRDGAVASLDRVEVIRETTITW